jgi:uncharacterized protein (UPF0335 family)
MLIYLNIRSEERKKSTEKVKKILKELDSESYDRVKKLVNAIKGKKSDENDNGGVEVSQSEDTGANDE